VFLIYTETSEITRNRSQDNYEFAQALPPLRDDDRESFSEPKESVPSNENINQRLLSEDYVRMIEDTLKMEVSHSSEIELSLICLNVSVCASVCVCFVILFLFQKNICLCRNFSHLSGYSLPRMQPRSIGLVPINTRERSLNLSVNDQNVDISDTMPFDETMSESSELM
jgi:hypothetical protein